MQYREKISVWTILKISFIVFVILITLYPFVYMIAVSFSSNIHVIKNEIWLFPKGLTFKVYDIVLKDTRLFLSYGNTIKYTVSGTAISLLLTCSSAYALSKRKRLPFYGIFNTIIIITMFFGGGMIPSYITVKNLGLLDTIWAVVFPGAISTWSLLIMRTFFKEFPTEIEESGKIDGMNDIQILWNLVLPTSQAIIATIGLFYSVALWNSFFTPFIYLSTPEKFPLQIILRNIILQGISFSNDGGSGSLQNKVLEEPLKFATIIVSVIPIIMVYPFIQKYFVKGVMIGSLKG